MMTEEACLPQKCHCSPFPPTGSCSFGTGSFSTLVFLSCRLHCAQTSLDTGHKWGGALDPLPTPSLCWGGWGFAHVTCCGSHRAGAVAGRAMPLLGTSAGWSPPCKHGHCTAPRESKAARIEVPRPVFPFGGTFKPAGEAEGIRKHIQQHKLYDLGKQCKCLST